jgi:hypothetical protein
LFEETVYSKIRGEADEYLKLELFLGYKDLLFLYI